jgi:hypothetical protein
MSAPSTTAPTQQVNVADLELPQLVEVKKQLEEVRSCFPCSSSPRVIIALNPIFALLGTLTPDQFFRSTEASAGQVPVVHRKRKGGQAREQRYNITAFFTHTPVHSVNKLLRQNRSGAAHEFALRSGKATRCGECDHRRRDGVLRSKGTGVFLCGHVELYTRAPLDASSGGEVLRRKDRLHQDESGHATGDDREEAGQYVLSPQRHPIQTAATQQQALVTISLSFLSL